MAKKVFARGLFPYVICVLIVFFIQCLIFDLPNSDMNIPSIYSGDAVAQQAIFKSIQQNGIKGMYVNPSLGAPYIADYRDYPNADLVTLFIIRIICLLTPNSTFALNIFLLATYYICAIITLFVMRKLGFNDYLAIAVALLYSFLPYHIIRHGHTALLLYGFIPLALPICQYIVSQPEKLFFFNGKMHFTKDGLYCIAACFLIAMTGVLYYSMFCGFLFLISSAYAYANAKKGKRKGIVINFAMVAGIILAAQVINYIPYFMYWAKAGINNAPLLRSGEDAEIYALKIIQLLIPGITHRIKTFAEFTQSYSENYPLVNENSTATLGIIGSIGFLYLLFRLFKINKNTKDHKAVMLDNLAVLNIACVLLGTIGGFGSLISLTLFAFIRGYNRISVVIALISFLALAYLLNDHIRKISIKSALVAMLATFSITSLGIYDQTRSQPFTSEYNVAFYNQQISQMQEIESHIDEGAMVLQYPYVSWPMDEYNYLKPYVYSQQDIRWSAGGVTGRGTHNLLSPINDMTAAEILSFARGIGFSHLLLDTSQMDEEGTGILRNAFSQAIDEPLCITDQYALYAIE